MRARKGRGEREKEGEKEKEGNAAAVAGRCRILYQKWEWRSGEGLDRGGFAGASEETNGRDCDS